MNILLVGQNLQIGGVQSSLVNFLIALNKHTDYTIDLFSFGDGELVNEVPESVSYFQGTRALRLVATPFQEVLKKRRFSDILYRLLLMTKVRLAGSTHFYDRLFQKQTHFGRYDIAISYFNDVAQSYFNQGTNQFVLDHVEAAVKLAWIHTDPIQAGFEKETCQKLYHDFDALICVSKACAEKLKAFLPAYAHKIHTVYNFFPIKDILKKAGMEDTDSELSKVSTHFNKREKCTRNASPILQALTPSHTHLIMSYDSFIETSGEKIGEFHISDEIKQIKPSFSTQKRKGSSTVSLVTVSRIDNGAKNLRRIFDVCQRLEKEGIRHYEWQIIGDGPDLKRNRKEIEAAGLSERVKYLGGKKNPYPYIQSSDLFVLTSNYEGFPMVIQEALILGVPVLTTPYAAVTEQVAHGVNGIITEMNTESLYQHLKVLLEAPFILEDLKRHIRHQPVSNDLALTQFTHVLKNKLSL